MLHKYVTPVAGFAVIVTLVVLHVNGPLFVALALGGVISCVTVVVVTAVQPLLLFVIVTVYVPGALTVLVRVVWPPLLHKYVTPVAGFAVKVTLVVMHVNGPSFVALADGTDVSPVTVVVATAVQPLLLFVTVTVYVPAVVTVFVCVV